MKKIMFGNSLMLLGIAIMILAGLKVIYVGTLWVSFLLIIVGFVMATIGFFGKDREIGRRYGRAGNTTGRRIQMILRQLRAELEGLSYEPATSL